MYIFSNSFALTTSHAVLMSEHDQFNVSGLLVELQKFPEVSSIFMLRIELGIGRKFGLGVKSFSCQCVGLDDCLKPWIIFTHV